MSGMTVAFDLKRLADSVRYDMANYGATQYAAELFRRLRGTGGIRVSPVVYADQREPCHATLDTAVAHLEAELGQGVESSWKQRRSVPGAVPGLRLLGSIPRGRRVIEPVIRTLDRQVYQQTPFSSAAHWDIYHSPVNPLPPTGWTGTAARVLTVLDVIHLKRPDLFPKGGTPPVRRALDSVDVERDYVVCISEATRRDVLSLLPIAEDRTCVIYLAATDTFDRPAREKAVAVMEASGIVPGRFVLALGQYDPRKNLKGIAKAFRQATSQPALADCRLVFVASAFRRRRISRELQACGLHPATFTVAADIDDETLAGLLAFAGVFVYAPLYEGFGIPVLEAMKADCPVITSNTSSLPEVGGQAAQYVDPTSVDAIAAAISRVLISAELRDSMKAKGKKQAAAFSWDKTTDDTIAFYEHVIRQRKPSTPKRLA